METTKEGVVTILKDGELVGIIYNDMKTRNKVMYSCTQMSEDDMIAVIEGKTEPKIVGASGKGGGSGDGKGGGFGGN